MAVYVCHWYLPRSSQPLLPSLCPQVRSLHLGLFSCPGDRFIITSSLDSIYTCINIQSFWLLVESLSHVQLYVNPWTVACWAPLSEGFLRQEYSSGLPFLPPGDLSDPGIEPVSPVLVDGFLTTEPLGSPLSDLLCSMWQTLGSSNIFSGMIKMSCITTYS